MRAYHYRYPVELSEEQRRWLETMVRMSNTPAKHYLVARILLMSDRSPHFADERSVSRRAQAH
jgi:hypothetical protein